jgi:hypothetical protein
MAEKQQLEDEVIRLRSKLATQLTLLNGERDWEGEELYRELA